MGAPAASSGDSAAAHVAFAPAEGAASADIRALLEYWNQLRGERAMPNRADIALAAIKKFLRHVHLYEVIDGGRDFRNRVMGTDVFIGKGTDSTGKLLSEETCEGARTRLGLPLRRVVDTGVPLRALTQRPGKNEYHVFDIESIWLPLGAPGSVDQVLAMTIYTPRSLMVPQARTTAFQPNV
ncbi:MAG: PAS domain-containing protein [Alphaproteobacteria bacterium]|nr:PAS domain-containing protein [Alphaproteobacteria bacterium]